MGGGPLQFYLRLPCKITDQQQVHSLHPDILKVTIPRQKSRNWCFIELRDEATAKELRQIKISGKRLTVAKWNPKKKGRK